MARFVLKSIYAGLDKKHLDKEKLALPDVEV